MIFNDFSTFKSSLQKYIQNLTERIDKIDTSNLGGTLTVMGIHDQLILDRDI